jgi:fatty acid desaturase
MYVKLIFSILTWLYLYYLSIYYFDSYILSSLFAVIWGISSANIGVSVMHDANHAALSKIPIINSIVGYLNN